MHNGIFFIALLHRAYHAPAAYDSLGVKKLLVLGALKPDDTREHKRHVPALVHDGRVAVRAAHLGRQLVAHALAGRVVEGEIRGPILKENVFLVEDGGPLEGRACGFAFVTQSI